MCISDGCPEAAVLRTVVVENDHLRVVPCTDTARDGCCSIDPHVAVYGDHPLTASPPRAAALREQLDRFAASLQPQDAAAFAALGEAGHLVAGCRAGFRAPEVAALRGWQPAALAAHRGAARAWWKQIVVARRDALGIELCTRLNALDIQQQAEPAEQRLAAREELKLLFGARREALNVELSARLNEIARDLQQPTQEARVAGVPRRVLGTPVAVQLADDSWAALFALEAEVYSRMVAADARRPTFGDWLDVSGLERQRFDAALWSRVDLAIVYTAHDDAFAITPQGRAALKHAAERRRAWKWTRPRPPAAVAPPVAPSPSSPPPAGSRPAGRPSTSTPVVVVKCSLARRA